MLLVQARERADSAVRPPVALRGHGRLKNEELVLQQLQKPRARLPEVEGLHPGPDRRPPEGRRRRRGPDIRLG